MEWIILAALVLDVLVGDPRWLPHPVVWIGKLILGGEKLVRRLTATPNGLRVGGVILVAMVVSGTYVFYWGLLHLAFTLHFVVGIIVSIIVMSQSLAVNSLYKHAAAVAKPLRVGQLTEARQALGMIVGRDTRDLDESQIVRGVVETVSENTVDGITAPLFYGFIGGPPLAMAYKAINTLDSMVGYRNDRYRDLGWAGARLDDVANYIPARLTGVLYLILAPFTFGGLRGVAGAIWRDAPHHPSPNSGIPEAAVAGALGVQLGGVNYYEGVVSNRALMGRKIKVLEAVHIGQSLGIMLIITAEAFLLGMALTRLLR